MRADLLATKYGYSRRDLDAYAVESQMRAARAWRERSIVPVRDIVGLTVLERDEIVRPDTTIESLAALEPSFGEAGRLHGYDDVALQRYPELECIEHLHYAGNSSGIVDGAAAVLIGSAAIGRKLGVKPRARIRSFASMRWNGAEPARGWRRCASAQEWARPPIACALNGTALGGGFEIALASHYRVAADDPSILLGLPEVQVGLLPAAGGTQRLPRLIGIQAAMPFLMEGKQLNPRKAQAAGWIHAVVPPDELLAEAKRWIRSVHECTQPWDRKDFRVPGGAGAMDPRIAGTFVASSALLHDKAFWITRRMATWARFSASVFRPIPVDHFR